MDTGPDRSLIKTVPVARPGRPSAAQARYLPNPKERDDSVEGQFARLQTMLDKEEEDEKAGETSTLLGESGSSSSSSSEPGDPIALGALVCRLVPSVYIPVFCFCLCDHTSNPSAACDI